MCLGHTSQITTGINVVGNMYDAYMCSECDLTYRLHASCNQSIVHAGQHDFLHTWLYSYGDIRQLMVRAKYNDEFGHFRCWASQCADVITHTHQFSADVIFTSIPSSVRSSHRRGYDQGALLARTIAQLCSANYQPLLVQSRQFQQTHHSREDRLDVPRYIATKKLKNREIFVIDDVATTRTSLRNAAETLYRSQVLSVRTFTLAFGVLKKV